MRPSINPPPFRTLTGHRHRKFTWLLPALLLIGGCTGALLPKGPPPALYNLTPKSTFPGSLQRVTWQLIIEEPVAAGGLDSSRIALRPRPTELQYFADARWTERAPRMIQTLLVESFENTEKIVAVGRQDIGLRSDINLKIELREFQAEYFEGVDRPRVRVRLNAKLIRQPRQEIVASKSFETLVPFEANSGMQPIIGAFDLALGRVMKQLIEWTFSHAHKGL